MMACYVGMGVVGFLLAIYGPILAVLQDRFDLSGTAVGSALGVQSLGAVVGVLAAQPLLRTRGNHSAVSTELFMICVGAAVIAVSPNWPVMLVGAAIAGLGFGGFDSVVTQILLAGSGERGQARVNVAHACFGLGTFVGPVLVFVVGARNYQWAFGAAALVSALAIVGARRMTGRITDVEARVAGGMIEASTAGRPPLLAAVVTGFLALYVTHFAVQAGIGNWGPIVLQQESHLTESRAVLAISGFWLAMVIGRFGAAALGGRMTPRTMVTISAAGLVAALACSLVPTVAPYAYLAAGLFIGPIFPTGLAWLSSTGYGKGNNQAYVIASSMVGLALAPTAVGAVIEHQGVAAAPSVLLAIAVAVLASSAVIIALAARASRTHRIA